MIIHSGGAEGADSVFGRVGAEFGFEVHAHTFAGHRVAGNELRKVHNNTELEAANDYLKKANIKLQRSFPPRSNFVLHLLQRNYYQLIHSDYVVAVAPLASWDMVKGGTGWATQMAIDMEKTVFVFDDGNTNRWQVYYEGLFSDLYNVFEMRMPPLNGDFAGIGSRAITEHGIDAIRSLLSQPKEERNTEWYGVRK